MKKECKYLVLGIFLLFSKLLFSSDEILIGLDADMSSVAAEGGIAIQRGALIAIDEINEKGGVLGKKLKLVVKDHRGNPARGLDNIEQFATMPNLVAVLGGVHTPVALYELEAIHKHKLIYLDPWAAGTPIVDNGYEPNFVFRVSVRDEFAGAVILKEVKKSALKNITLVLERTGWGRSNEKSMTVAAQELGLNIVNTVWFNWGEQNFKNHIVQSIKNNTEAFVLVANTPEGSAFIKGLASIENAEKYPVFSHWGVTGGNFLQKVSLISLSKVKLSVLQTFSFLNGYNQKKADAVFNAYLELFEESYTKKSIPSAPGVAHAYDLIHLLAMAIESTGGIDRSQVRDALERIEQHKGLVKNYKPPFTPARHDALFMSDYQMCRYDENGNLIPNNLNN